MSKIRHILSSIARSSKGLLTRPSRTRDEKSSLARNFLERLKKAGQKKQARPRNNRRKKATPELQEFIKCLKAKNVSRKIIGDVQELAHYYYIFDAQYYKNQLKQTLKAKPLKEVEQTKLKTLVTRAMVTRAMVTKAMATKAMATMVAALQSLLELHKTSYLRIFKI